MSFATAIDRYLDTDKPGLETFTDYMPPKVFMAWYLASKRALRRINHPL